MHEPKGPEGMHLNACMLRKLVNIFVISFSIIFETCDGDRKSIIPILEKGKKEDSWIYRWISLHFIPWIFTGKIWKSFLSTEWWFRTADYQLQMLPDSSDETNGFMDMGDATDMGFFNMKTVRPLPLPSILSLYSSWWDENELDIKYIRKTINK